METRRFIVELEVAVPTGPGDGRDAVAAVLAAGDDGCRPTISSVVPLDLTIAVPIERGHTNISGGDDLAAMLRHAARLLELADAADILGGPMIVGDDGRAYTITVEAVVAEATPAELGAVADGLLDGVAGRPVYVQPLGEDGRYGYEVARGGGWAVVRIGRLGDEDAPVEIVPESRCFTEEQVRRGMVWEDLTWDHPDDPPAY